MPPAGRDAAADGWSYRSESHGPARVAHWNQSAEQREKDDNERRPHESAGRQVRSNGTLPEQCVRCRFCMCRG
ncbi:MAG: hypothetical protein LBQ54_11235 [Planctomycetaceae bacterium]|nr:hypothetical protein [Planctomycetaceae bacterium]